MNSVVTQRDPDLASSLLSALQILPIARLSPSKTSRGTLRIDLLRLISASDEVDLDRIERLLKSAATNDPDDALVWDQVYHAVTESTPPPPTYSLVPPINPLLRNTSSFANSSEHRRYVDDVLKRGLGHMYAGLRNLHDTYFGSVGDLETASEAGFKDEELAAFAEDRQSTPMRKRRPLARPNGPIDGPVGKRKIDVGFVNDPEAGDQWAWKLAPSIAGCETLAIPGQSPYLDVGVTPVSGCHA
ncbi:hypothetical protein DL768_010211 [Monosporascus sp. mg162]|nr:hypothetical protein DL768_010211 [Monosporascus sp. mg162]